MENLKSLFNRDVPDFLCHYTEGDAFQNILKTNVMWASHIRFMNDSTEGILARDEIIKIFNEKNFDVNFSEVNIEELKKLVKGYFAEYASKKGIFVLSFSGKDDDLNQWRAYANNAPSYCIKFNSEKLIQSSKIISDIEKIKDFVRDGWNCNSKKILLLPCVYDDKKQEELAREIIKDSLDRVNQEKLEKGALAMEIAKRLIVYAPVIKNKVFIDENEWRIIIIYEKLENSFSEEEKYCGQTDSEVQKSGKGDGPVGFRMGKSMIIPYYKFLFQKDVVSEIVIGACPDRNSVKESTIYFLSKNGFSYEDAKKMVKETKCPYRNW